MEAEARRQHLHAVVAEVRDEHEVVGCDAHLPRLLELQTPITPASDPTWRGGDAITVRSPVQTVYAGV
jgi:hypothetical protein